MAPSTELLYIHPALKLADLGGGRGCGYTASRAIRRGELLLEELPMAWDSGADAQRPDLAPGAEWLLRSGAVHELSPGPEPAEGFGTLRRRADAVASRCAFRNQSPCADGSYVAMLFRASSRFNHSCFPNAGAYSRDCAEVPSAAAFVPEPLCTFALEDIAKGEEVCICYLSEVDQLSPARSRQAALSDGWGFTCACRRCQGGRPLDRSLEGFADDAAVDFERRRVAAGAGREFRALFDPSAEDYDPPMGDFDATVQRLTQFRDTYRMLHRAHCAMQRVRRELLAALLLDGPEGPIGRRHALAAAALLVEEMLVLNELLPLLSPCKAPLYARFLRVMRNVPEREAHWLRRDAKVDGCELWHRNALWVHHPAEASRLQAERPLNIPPRPAPGPPPRTGPPPSPGACCLAALASRRPARCSCAGRPARARWPRRGRRRQSPEDDMPVLLEWMQPHASQDAVARPPDLWEAYGEYGRPSAAARTVRRAAGAASAPGAAPRRAKEPWFRFKV